MVRKAVINSNATRYLATESYDEVAPHAIQLMSLAYETGFFLGSALPANWSAQNWKAMGGISINKGTAEGWRTGTQVYLKNTMIQMQIDMGNILNQNSVHPILEFRLIVFKNKGIQYLAGGGADPATHLLLNSANEPTGSAVSNINGTDLILNKAALPEQIKAPCLAHKYLQIEDFKSRLTAFTYIFSPKSMET